MKNSVPPSVLAAVVVVVVLVLGFFAWRTFGGSSYDPNAKPGELPALKTDPTVKSPKTPEEGYRMLRGGSPPVASAPGGSGR
jgi:hypothetical protein